MPHDMPPDLPADRDEFRSLMAQHLGDHVAWQLDLFHTITEHLLFKRPRTRHQTAVAILEACGAYLQAHAPRTADYLTSGMPVPEGLWEVPTPGRIWQLAVALTGGDE